MNIEPSEPANKEASADNLGIRQQSDDVKDVIGDRYIPIANIGYSFALVMFYFLVRTHFFGWPETVAAEMDRFYSVFPYGVLAGFLFNIITLGYYQYKTRPWHLENYLRDWLKALKWRYNKWTLLAVAFVLCNEFIIYLTFPETYPFATDPAMIGP